MFRRCSGLRPMERLRFRAWAGTAKRLKRSARRRAKLRGKSRRQYSSREKMCPSSALVEDPEIDPRSWVETRSQAREFCHYKGHKGEQRKSASGVAGLVRSAGEL